MSNQSTRRKSHKRTNRSGTTWFAKGENRWRAQFVDANGKQRSLSAKTEQEIGAKLELAIRERDQGMLGRAPGDTPLLSEWLNTWIDFKYELKPKTTARNKTDINLYLNPRLGRIRIDLLNPSNITAFYASLKKETNLSDSSIRRIHGTLSSAMNEAYIHGVIPTRIMEKVKAPKIVEVERSTIKDEEVKKLLELAAAKGLREKVRWELGLIWGLRQGEVLGLRWQDINFDSGVMKIRQQSQYFPGKGMVITEPKAQSSKREVQLDSKTLTSLKSLKSELEASGRVCTSPAHPDLVLLSANNGPVNTSSDRVQFHRMLIALNLPDFRVHDARHTAITKLANSGLSLATVSRVAGHADIHTTMKYIHTDAHARAELAGWVDKARV